MRTLPQTAAYMWGGRCLKGPQRPDCAHPFSRSVRAAIWLPLRYAGRLRGRAWPIAIWAAGRSCRAGSTSSTLSLNWLKHQGCSIGPCTAHLAQYIPLAQPSFSSAPS